MPLVVALMPRSRWVACVTAAILFSFSVERALMLNGLLLLVSSNLKASNSQDVESASSKLRGFSPLSLNEMLDAKFLLGRRGEVLVGYTTGITNISGQTSKTFSF